jgi:hypothetical protein
MSRFTDFKAQWAKDPDGVRAKLKGDGTYEYLAQVKDLEQLQRKICTDMMVYLFDEHPGRHLAEKFADQCHRNLLFFLPQLTAEYRMFLLYELKTNPNLMMYG